MRLVSQHGSVDVPYNLYSVNLVKTYEFYRIMASYNKEYILLADYSTEAKALKAMEMLREAFAGKFVFKNVDLDDSVFELLKEWKSKGIVVTTNDDTQDVQYINNAIFQFPKDEEIEV